MAVPKYAGNSLNILTSLNSKFTYTDEDWSHMNNNEFPVKSIFYSK